MDKRRKVKAMIQNLDQASYEDLVKSESLRDLVIRETPLAIKLAIKNRLSFATIFEINNTNNFVEIHKRDWIPALESCIAYYVDKENYEECTKINSVVEELKKTKTKKTVIKSHSNE